MKRRIAIALLALGLVWAPMALAATDEEQIRELISQFWQSYQNGDFDTMAKYVAEDVVVVSGDPSPDIKGWNNVRQAYSSLHSARQIIQFAPQNPGVTVRGKCAWATQQWTFSAVAAADRQPFNVGGHSTLIFEKRSGRWLIVLNHSSVATLSQPRGQTPPPANPPR